MKRFMHFVRFITQIKIYAFNIKIVSLKVAVEVPL
jgi:hypothetical protein